MAAQMAQQPGVYQTGNPGALPGGGPSAANGLQPTSDGLQPKSELHLNSWCVGFLRYQLNQGLFGACCSGT